jgi:hypothetical protein
MASPESAGPPSLLGVTLRRSVVMGRLYLLGGTAFSLFYATVFSFAGGQSFDSAVPILLPIFAVTGGLGSLVVFTNDRLKGVFEYLIAYGTSPRRLFLNYLVAGIALTSIVLGVSLGVGLTVHFAAGSGVSRLLVGLLLLYTVPMSYASIAFTSTVGMFWTSLSSPRAGMNSPIGLIPIIGMAPSLVTLGALLAVLATGALPYYVVTGTAVGLIVLVVAVLLSQMERLMPRERLLSPA